MHSYVIYYILLPPSCSLVCTGNSFHVQIEWPVFCTHNFLAVFKSIQKMKNFQGFSRHRLETPLETYHQYKPTVVCQYSFRFTGQRQGLCSWKVKSVSVHIFSDGYILFKNLTTEIGSTKFIFIIHNLWFRISLVNLIFSKHCFSISCATKTLSLA